MSSKVHFHLLKMWANHVLWHEICPKRCRPFAYKRGASNMLEDSEICAIVKSGGDVEERARKLITAANQNGGKDNISVVLVEPLSGEVKEC